MDRATHMTVRRGWTTLLMLLSALVIAAAVTGCAATPRERFAQANDTYIAAVSALLDAKAAGAFTEQEWQEDIVPLIQLGDTILDEYDLASRTGADTGSVARRLSDLLARLRPFIIEATSDRKDTR